MDKTKHTPGPWKVEWPFEGGALITADDGHGELAQVKTRYSKTNNLEEAEANARLIAAAPDLLEAICDLELRMTQAALASGIGPRKNHTDFLLGELGRMKDVARAAIARAKGE